MWVHLRCGVELDFFRIQRAVFCPVRKVSLFLLDQGSPSIAHATCVFGRIIPCKNLAKVAGKMHWFSPVFHRQTPVFRFRVRTAPVRPPSPFPTEAASRSQMLMRVRSKDAIKCEYGRSHWFDFASASKEGAASSLGKTSEEAYSKIITSQYFFILFRALCRAGEDGGALRMKCRFFASCPAVPDMGN